MPEFVGRFVTVFKCTTCGEMIPLGEGAMDRADTHEREATQIDPDFRDHFVEFVQVESSVSHA